MPLTLQDVKDKIASSDPLTYEEAVFIMNAGETKLEDLKRQLAGLQGKTYEAPYRGRHVTAPTEISGTIKDLGIKIAAVKRQINDANNEITADLSDAIKESSAGLDL